MDVWQFLGLILVAGGIGGLVNSLLSDKGLTLPYTVTKGDGTSIFLPGFVGNVLIGGIAAGVSWLLYGPFTQVQFNANVLNVTTTMLASLGGAVLVGMSGAGWLSNAVDKHVLKAAAVQAAAAPADPTVAQQIQHATPVQALKLAQSITTDTPPVEDAVLPTTVPPPPAAVPATPVAQPISPTPVEPSEIPEPPVTR